MEKGKYNILNFKLYYIIQGEKMKSKIVGGIILLLVIIVIIAFQFVNVNKPEEITVSGYLGGEKEGLMQDEEVKKILKDKYGITVEYTKAGSIEMIEQDSSDKDYLFPSSQTALELFNQTKSDKLYKSEIVFNSPIVIYTWKPIVEALINNRIVEEKDNSYYIADTSALIKLVTDKKKWSDIGVNDLYGYVTIQSTDPNKSNSGNMFAGLVANIMNNETVVDSSTVDTILPNLKDFFGKIGYMEHSSGDLFEQYLKTGMGAKPMIAGYENQMIEFAIENPNDWNMVKEQVAVLYPEPTVWSSHPLIALNEKGAKLIEAMQDEEIQKIAWEKHGFRTGVNGTINTEIEGFYGIPKNINAVIQMPNPDTMQKIMDGIK